MVDPVWQDERFDAERWAAAEALSDVWRHRLPELRVAHVVGTRPVIVDGRRFNQGFLWSASERWRRCGASSSCQMNRGAGKPAGSIGVIPTSPNFTLTPGRSASTSAPSCGLSRAYAAYAAQSVQVILSPRATAAATTARWLAVGWWRRCARVHSACRPTAWTRRVHAAVLDGSSTRRETSWRGRPPMHHSRRSTSTCPPQRRRGTNIPATCSAGERGDHDCAIETRRGRRCRAPGDRRGWRGPIAHPATL